MEKQEILVGQSNGSRHSVWEASANMGCDLRRCNISTLFGLFGWFGYASQRVINWISHLVKIYSFKDWPLKKLWGEGGEFSSRMKFPLYEFFRPLREYFLAFGVHEYLSFNFPLREYIFFVLRPRLPLNYEYAQYFHLFNLCKWWVPLIHQCKLCNACQAFAIGMKRNFLTTKKFYNYRL